MPLDIRSLRFFVHVAELGSMSLASRALNIAQPALSQRMSGLEDHLGVQLLLRSPRGVEVTEEGRRFLAHAREVLERIRIMEEELGRQVGILRGTVTVGMPAPAANVLLEPLVLRLRAAHPELKLKIEEARTIALHEGLLSGHLDLAITANQGESGRTEAQPLADENLHLVSAAGRGFGETIRFADMFELPLVISSHIDRPRTAINLIAARLNGRLNIVLESTSLPTTKRLIANGDFHGIMTWSAAAEEVGAGTLVAARIVEPDLPRPLFLCQLHDRRHSTAVQAVAAEIHAIAQDLAMQAILR